MTTAELRSTAASLDSNADLLDSALLAPSLKSQTLRAQAADLRRQADQQEAAVEYGRLASRV